MVHEVARVLSVSAATVYRLCQSGKLANIRTLNTIRITSGALAAFNARLHSKA
jgi:excisionase family DNA binding protein